MKSYDPRTFLTRVLQFVLLGALCACAKSDAQWEADLESEDPFVRGMAAIGLSLQSPESAGPAVPTLLKTIDRSDVGLEEEAARVLAHVGPFHVELLLQHLVEEELMSADRKGSIKNALVLAGPRAPGPIVACLRDDGAFLVGDLGDVLLSIGEPAVPSIIVMLREAEDVRLRNFAAFLLSRLGPRARAALPALRDALESSDPGVRDMARQALAAIEGAR